MAFLASFTRRPDPAVAARLKQAGRNLLNALLPPRCATCDVRVSVQGQLCAACFASTNFITAPMCLRCGVPFATMEQAGADSLCLSCRQHPPLFGQARGALRYDDRARRLVLPLKHAGRIEVAPVLAGMMLRAGADLLWRADVLVPVPLHQRRLFTRQYNQAAVLAIGVGGHANKPVVPDALARVRRTSPLDNKSPEDRSAEVAGSIQVRPSRALLIGGKNVLLVDDVMTSGATANACAAALLRAGAAAVDVLVAARVPDPRLR